MIDAYDEGYAGGRAWLAEIGIEANVTDPIVEAAHTALVAGRELIDSDSWTAGFTDALLGTHRDVEAASDDLVADPGYDPKTAKLEPIQDPKTAKLEPGWN